MIRMDEEELRLHLSVAVSVSMKGRKSPWQTGALIDKLVQALRPFEVWRKEQLHELAIEPLPLFPADRTHLEAWKKPGPGPE